MKSKLLCILHRSPPTHGAAKVGDFIVSSKNIKEKFDCRFITIKSSTNLGDIGKVNLKKIFFLVALYIKIFWLLVSFRPNKIYFTASVKGVAFYRDLLLSTLWKGYSVFKSTEVYYHYHTKGIDNFVSSSFLNAWLMGFFLKRVNLVLMSQILRSDLANLNTYKTVSYLSNGVEDHIKDIHFYDFLATKYAKVEPIEVLYLSNMIREKGYFNVLELATEKKEADFHFHFAGGWQSSDEEREFFGYIKENGLEQSVTFHGFVSGAQKQKLFERAHFFIFPTRYQNETFPLSILEALSYGVPVITTDEGSIPSMIDEKCGIVIDTTDQLSEALSQGQVTLFNYETAMYCRERFLKEFSLNIFEGNFIKILNG